MMDRLSLHQNSILKRISFRAYTDLHSAVSNAVKWLEMTVKPIYQCRKATPQPVLTSSTPPQIATTDTTLKMLSP